MNDERPSFEDAGVHSLACKSLKSLRAPVEGAANLHSSGEICSRIRARENVVRELVRIADDLDGLDRATVERIAGVQVTEDASVRGGMGSADLERASIGGIRTT